MYLSFLVGNPPPPKPCTDVQLSISIAPFDDEILMMFIVINNSFQFANTCANPSGDCTRQIIEMSQFQSPANGQNDDSEILLRMRHLGTKV